MSLLAKWLTFYLINSAWQLPILAAITALTLRMMPKPGAELRYRLWVSCLLLSVTLPALSASLGIKTAYAPPSYKQANAPTRWTTPRSNDDGPLTMRFTEIAAPSSKHGTAMVLPGLYLISLLIGAVKLLRGLNATRALVKAAHKSDLNPIARNLLDRAAQAYQISPVKVYTSADLPGPAIVSWPEPMLIVPPTLMTASADETAIIFAHELAHIRRKDFETNLLLEILSILAFYHPATRWIKRRIAESREIVCDELAADSTTGRAAYALSLLNMAHTAFNQPQASSYSLGILESTNLERRIMNLVDTRLPLTAKRKLIISICCWSLLAGGSVGAVLFSLHPSTVHAAGSPALLYDPTQTFDTLTPKAARKPAPNFTLTDNNGRPLTLSSYKGKVVLLNFWATWCGGCKLEIPWYMEFDKKYKNQGLAVIGVSMDEGGWKTVKPFLAKKRDAETGVNIAMQYPIVIGTDSLAKQFGLTSMPMTLLIDRDGRIAVSHTGVVDKDNFENNIRALLK
jgi:cytochrome c biogenesis protein CcmG/thiol:disulfide interchange protein DsbE